MKKIMIAASLSMLIILGLVHPVEADEYQNYQEIVFVEESQKMLQDFTKKDYADYYSNYVKKYFMGWKILTVTKNESVDFVSETKLKVYNNGYSTIKHDISLSTKEETKFQVSASGEIDVKLTGDVKKFKGGLDAGIKTSIQYSKTTNTVETYDFMIIVDPGTYVTIVTKGQGVVSNGVAKHYLFWIMTKKGGWETFTVTTEYFEIIKERLK